MASFAIAGAVSPARVKNALKDLEATWKGKEVVIPDYSSGWAPTALLTPSAATFLHMCVYSGLNILLIALSGEH